MNPYLKTILLKFLQIRAKKTQFFSFNYLQRIFERKKKWKTWRREDEEMNKWYVSEWMRERRRERKRDREKKTTLKKTLKNNIAFVLPKLLLQWQFSADNVGWKKTLFFTMCFLFFYCLIFVFVFSCFVMPSARQLLLFIHVF